MRKLAFAASVAAALAGVALAGCSDKENNAPANSTDAASKAKPKVQGESFEPTTNIRYYNMDSVMANYELVKTYTEANLRTTRELENALQSRQSEIQRLAANIQQKAQNNGYLSEASYNADMQELQRKQQQAESYIGNLQARAQQEGLRQNQEFLDSIDSFLTYYNSDKHYDAILLASPGQYFNPALDITADVIAGLNARYKKAAAKDGDAKDADAPKGPVPVKK